MTIKARVCETNFDWTREVPSSTGTGTYEVAYGESQLPARKHTHEYSCTCIAWRMKGYCKHVAAVKDERCGWGEEVFMGKMLLANVDGSCPNCGGPTREVEVDL